jgi:hypothetical protein
MTRLISFSLYGKDRPGYDMYFNGMLENLRLARVYYPGWTVRVYCEADTDVGPLMCEQAEIVHVERSHEHSGMLWRFVPIWDAGVSRVIFRDADSRLNPREAAAVQAWIDSGLAAHCMHDHEHHRSLPLMGGMWGVVSGVVPCMMAEWMRYMSTMQRRVSDMHLLRNSVWPHVRHSLLRHSSVELPAEWGEYHPFPDHAPWDGFVGQQVRADGSPIWPGR